jgi:hypothetical protein
MKKCKYCVWGTRCTPNKVLCMFPSCFKAIEVKRDAKETIKTLQTSRLSGADRRKVL